MIAYLGIGTNLGDRTANLHRAVDRINEQAGHVLACSSFIETEPWGFSSDNAFLNAVVEIDTPYTPHELLRMTQEIERTMGRKHKSVDGVYKDRIIDIDILLYGDLTVNDAQLTIPHPLMWQRRFVYEPLWEIAPHLKQR
ncbi:MAG: 2-amino-4-hydroxy-6-hydroxymethyldihydropteridine diphosphokinase [Bacteroidaceae bacterium]|nr:2-amino-4-hydroxy-6-hydroxymethyldihydropteridine diphosphokinase [Bacteroidaceae bacterium]